VHFDHQLRMCQGKILILKGILGNREQLDLTSAVIVKSAVPVTKTPVMAAVNPWLLAENEPVIHHGGILKKRQQALALHVGRCLYPNEVENSRANVDQRHQALDFDAEKTTTNVLSSNPSWRRSSKNPCRTSSV